jgi:hypothetical protein
MRPDSWMFLGCNWTPLMVPKAPVDHHGASHDDLSDGYERITRFHLSSFANLAKRLDSMPEGEGTVLGNSCLLSL